MIFSSFFFIGKNTSVLWYSDYSDGDDTNDLLLWCIVICKVLFIYIISDPWHKILQVIRLIWQLNRKKKKEWGIKIRVHSLVARRQVLNYRVNAHNVLNMENELL